MSGQTALTIIHPCDPLRPGIGGFDACIYAILKYAPANWQIELIGITTNPEERPVRKWHLLEFHHRTIRFYPVLSDLEPDRVRRIPLSLRFATAGLMSRVKASGKIIQFHRFESSYAIRFSRNTQHSVYFMHNDPVEEVSSSNSSVRWKYFRKTFFSLLRRRIAGTSAVVVVHPESVNWVETHTTATSGTKIFVLKQWADPEFFFPTSEIERKQSRSDLRRRFNLPQETKIAIFAGRLEMQKDPELLIRSFDKLNQSRSDAVLLIVGKGRMEDSLRLEIQKLGLQEKVRLSGPVSWSDLAEMYRGCDVAVCTSAYEAGPRHVFEALACGIPVVCTNVGQAQDLIRKDSICGRIIRSRDATDFAQAISDVLNQTNSLEIVDRCRLALADFSPQNALAPLFHEYSLWLEGSPPVSAPHS